MRYFLITWVVLVTLLNIINYYTQHIPASTTYFFNVPPNIPTLHLLFCDLDIILFIIVDW